MPSVPGWLVVLERYVPSSRTGRVLLIVAGSTLVVLSATGLYLRRRRRKYGPPTNDESVDYTRIHSTSIMSPYSHRAESMISTYRSGPGDELSEERLHWQQASQIHTTEGLCDAGLLAVQTAVHYWHNAVTRLRNQTSSSDLGSSSSSDFDVLFTIQSLEALIDQAHAVEEMYRQRIRALHPDLLHSHSDSDSFVVAADVARPFRSSSGARTESSPQFQECFSPETTVTDGGNGPVSLRDAGAGGLLAIERQTLHTQPALSESSSVDSFVSATMQLDDPEVLTGRGLNLSFYNVGMDAALARQVPFRSLRTGMLSCLSDNDFLAKLFCIRQAFEHILGNKAHREWIVNSGCQLVSLFLQAAGKEAQAFTTEYQAMVAYVESTPSDAMFAELKERRLACFSFYDVVLDFALMDAFADLEHPPSTITSVLANRWLTDGFKETALNTAVWSMLKAKRSLVQTNGFMHHFYNVMSTLSPILAWGFLGPSRSLRGQCAVFKEQLLHLMRDMFSLTTVRYSSVEALSEDVLESTKLTFQQLVEHFQASMASH